MRRIFIIAIGLTALTLSGATWATNHTTHHPAATKSAPKPTAMKPPTGAGPQGGMMGGISMDQMMKMMETMHPAIAVDDSAIYIIRGGEVLKLDKNTLQVQSRAMLPEMQSMMSSMMQMPPSQFDQSFLQNMIRHHAGAIAMSRIVVQKATNPELRQFAQRVIDTQSQQNREMATWLKSWYRSSGSMAPMPMDEQTTRQLRGLSSRDIEIIYMQAMIMHHQEAVDMGRVAEQKAGHPEIKTLATSIVTGQSAEISQLSGWLSDWYKVKP
ncbi:MAG: DUF305 domain-containing protein [Armatimonadota bacterium]